MNHIRTLSVALALVLAAGCAKEYDDSAIKDRLDTLEEQVQENANALKKLQGKLDEVSDKGLTLSVDPVAGGKTLTFSDGTVITVMDGTDGPQGPQGPSGDAGSDAVVTITESSDGLSYVITMDGKEYIVGKTLSFSLKVSATELSMAPEESVDLTYTLTGGEDAVVFVSSCSGYTAVVDMEASKVTVTAPAELPDNGFIILTARKATGEEYSQYIGFLKGNLTVTADAETVAADGGTVTLTINADCDYVVVIPESCTWIEQVDKKSMTISYVYLQVAANPDAAPRTAVVKISSSAGYKDVVIAQEAGENVMSAANSFIVSEEGTYKFKAVKGNSSESVGDVASCAVLWESFGTADTPSEKSLISSVSYSSGIVTFSTASTFKEGNAVIAAKDAGGKILWSWHIWLTDEPQGQEYYQGAGIVMDRNLGAVSAVPGEVGALGLFYQWGRKDPFLGSSSVSDWLQAESTIEWPASVTSDATTGTVGYAVANPTVFIAHNTGNYDWYYTGSADTDNTRWSPGTKTLYDPCPAGWRVPIGGSSGVWATALGTGDDLLDATKYDSTNKGLEFSGLLGGAGSIWYPLAGYLNGGDAVLKATGSTSYYWSVTENGIYAYRFYLDNTGNIRNNFWRRSFGQSVRCVKD